MQTRFDLVLTFQPNHERKPLDEMNAVDEEDMIDQQVDAKDHPISGSSQAGSSNEGTAGISYLIENIQKPNFLAKITGRKMNILI